MLSGGSRTKNTIRTIIASLFNRIVAIILPFINRTLVIYILGAEILGLASLFLSILGVLNLAELGFSSAIVFSMYKPIADHDKEKICYLLTLYRKIYYIVGIIILCMGMVISPFLSYMIKGDVPEEINIYFLFYLYLFDAVISYFLYAYKEALLIADQRKDISQWIRTLILVLRYILQMFVLIFLKNFYIYIAISVFGTIITNIVISIVVSKKYPQYEYKKIKAVKIPEEIKKQVKGLTVDAICDKARNSLDSIILSGVLGLTAVAIYNNYFYIYSALYGITLTICNAMSASVGNSIAKESVEKNYKDLLKFSFIQAWCSGIISICMLCLYQAFMKFWVGENLMISEWSMSLICIYFFVINLNNIRNQFISGSGMWWNLKWKYLAEALANLILNLILGTIWGISGIISASIITIVFMNFIWRTVVLFRTYFVNISVRTFFIDNLQWLFVTVLAAGITYYLCGWINAEGIKEIILKLPICLTVPNILFYLCYFRTKEFEDAKKFLSSARKIMIEK